MGCAVTLNLSIELNPACGPGGGVQSRPGEVPNQSLKLFKILPLSLRLEWEIATDAQDYNVYRGNIKDLLRFRTYDHIVSLGGGTCSNSETFYEDPDDLIDEGDFYYLVSAVSTCGLEGPSGFDSGGTERPGGGGCP